MKIEFNEYELKLALKNYIKAEFNKDANTDDIRLKGSYGVTDTAMWEPEKETFNDLEGGS